MAAPVVQGWNQVGAGGPSGGGNSINVSPSPATAGDLLCAFFGVNGTDASGVTAPAGYVDGPFQNHTVARTQASIYKLAAAGGETNINPGGTGCASAVMITVRGLINATIGAENVGWKGASYQNDTTPTTPIVTPPSGVPGISIICLWHQPGSQTAGSTYTLTNYTKAADTGPPPAGNRFRMVIMYRAIESTSGSYGGGDMGGNALADSGNDGTILHLFFTGDAPATNVDGEIAVSASAVISLLASLATPGALAAGGAGSAAFGAALTMGAAADHVGAGALSNTAGVVRSGHAELDGAAGLGVSGSLLTSGALSVSGVGSLALAGVGTYAALVDLAGSGQFAGTPSEETQFWDGELDAAGAASFGVSGLLDRLAAFAGDGSAQGSFSGAVARSGALGLTGSAAAIHGASLVTSAALGLGAEAQVELEGFRVTSGALGATGAATLGGAPQLSIASALVVDGSSSFGAEGQKGVTAAWSIGALASYTATGVIPPRPGDVGIGISVGQLGAEAMPIDGMQPDVVSGGLGITIETTGGTGAET